MIAGIVLGALIAVVVIGVAAHEVHLARSRRRAAAAAASARRRRRVRAQDHHESDPTMLMPVCLQEPASERLDRIYRERGPS